MRERVLRFPALPRSFYARSALSVARDAIGKLLVHRTRGALFAAKIVEAEAYSGPHDRAAHSYGNRRTARTEVMFGPPGHAYMFILYGMHWHLNLVTGRTGQPHAVLLRAVEPIVGTKVMGVNRVLDPNDVRLTNGPGKLCQAFALDALAYGCDLTAPPLYLTDFEHCRVARSPRIGVDYAGEWATRPWRFYDASSRYVSGPASMNGRGRARTPSGRINRSSSEKSG